jgi:hypothetical protein
MSIKKKLQDIKKKKGSIESLVAKEAIDYWDIEGFFRDLAQSGCESGMVTSLIYYTDTHKFYDKYYDEIELIRINYEDETGIKIKIGNKDLKNQYAWFAFEKVALDMASELGIEI